MAEDSFVEKVEGQVFPEQVADLSEEIGEEGSLASIRSRVPKMRANPDTGNLEEIPVASEEVKPKEVEVKEKAAGPRFKSRAEAEKAHAEAERKMHEATTAAAQKEEALAAKEAALTAAKQEAADLKQQLEEALAAKPPEKKEGPTEEEADAQLEATAEAANEQAINEIGELDSQDPDYKKLVARAWARANAKIIKAAAKVSLSQAEIEKLFDQRIEANDAAAKAEADKKTAVDADAALWAQAFEMAGKSGLDVDDGSAERDLFEVIARRDLSKQKFMQSETPPPLKDQVDWVVKEVRSRLGKKIAQTDEERRKAREHQERNQPLTRGGVTKPPAEETLSEPASLASIRQQDIERRRARHRGV